ncbi:hypothetical protein ACFYU8_05870 [Brevibacillus sp. NPDC003359]
MKWLIKFNRRVAPHSAIAPRSRRADIDTVTFSDWLDSCGM